MASVFASLTVKSGEPTTPLPCSVVETILDYFAIAQLNSFRGLQYTPSTTNVYLETLQALSVILNTIVRVYIDRTKNRISLHHNTGSLYLGWSSLVSVYPVSHQ